MVRATIDSRPYFFLQSALFLFLAAVGLGTLLAIFLGFVATNHLLVATSLLGFITTGHLLVATSLLGFVTTGHLLVTTGHLLVATGLLGFVTASHLLVATSLHGFVTASHLLVATGHLGFIATGHLLVATFHFFATTRFLHAAGLRGFATVLGLFIVATVSRHFLAVGLAAFLRTLASLLSLVAHFLESLNDFSIASLLAVIFHGHGL